MQEKESKAAPHKLKQIIEELDSLGYEYIEGFVSNKKDKVRAVHRECGKERYTKFSLYSQKDCRFCKRLKTEGKFQKAMNQETKILVLQMHNEGKTNIEIAKKVGFSNSAVRQFLKKNNIQSNKIPSTLKESECIVCGNVFMPKYHRRDKVCSKECVSKHISKVNTKYTQNEINKVIKLKQLKQTNKDIQEITGVNNNKIKEIVKDNELFLSKEEAQGNAYQKKIEKNPNAMQHMRSFHVPKYNIKDLIAYAKNKKGKCLSSKYTGYHTLYKWKCEKKHEWEATWASKSSSDQWCPMCSTLHSKSELEILDWIKSFGLEAYSTKKIIPPKEIDIFIPSLNLGIEYCGLYWHTEAQEKHRTYHYDKMKSCEEQGVRLITIFEDEWTNRQTQVKNFLKSVLGIHSKKVYARKCSIKQVDKNTAKSFLESNHIQGKTIFLVAFGIFFDNELLGLVTGNKHHRQGHQNKFVLNRLVFKDEVQVVGGSSRLLKHLIEYAKQNNYEKLISWSDNRWSQGNVYKKVGFDLIEDLGPDYSYVTPELTRQSKQSNKKKLLIKKGADGDMSMTEKELALTLGYSRIWDCGKKNWQIVL